MPKYFGSIQLVIEATDEAAAQAVQRRAAEYAADVDDGMKGASKVVSASSDEPVEEDEYGHAG